MKATRATRRKLPKGADQRYPPKRRIGKTPNGAQRSRMMDPQRAARLARNESHARGVAKRRAANKRARIARRVNR